MIGAAAVEIILLWIVIGVTMYLFYRIQPAAAYLLIPYIAWVTFAAILTVTIWTLNGTEESPQFLYFLKTCTKE